MRRGDSADYALSTPDAQKVLNACSTLEERFIIGSQIFLGLRAGELAHFNSQWITSDGQNIKIPLFMPCSCVYCARRSNEWRPKTKAGARMLPISKPLRPVLTKFLEKSPGGLGYSRIGVYNKTKAVLKRVKLMKRPGLAGGVPFPHALRATCAGILARAGMSAIALCFFMGWESIQIADHYIRASQAQDEALRQARAIFDKT